MCAGIEPGVVTKWSRIVPDGAGFASTTESLEAPNPLRNNESADYMDGGGRPTHDSWSGNVEPSARSRPSEASHARARDRRHRPQPDRPGVQGVARRSASGRLRH